MDQLMSLVFFESASSGSGGRLPFVEDYVETHTPPYDLLPVLEIKRSRKKTGYSVNTKAYSVFLFEGSQILNQMLEALTHWIESGQGYMILVQASEMDPFYKIAVDHEKPVQWAYAQGKYTWQPPTGSGSDRPPTTNPFLPPTQQTTRTRHKSAQTPSTSLTSGA